MRGLVARSGQERGRGVRPQRKFSRHIRRQARGDQCGANRSRAMTIEMAAFGRLGRDAELKTSKNGNQYLRFNMRCGDGDAAQWLSVMAFDREAITAAAKFVQHARV